MALGQYAVGRNLTVVALTPQTVNPTTGIITPGTTVVITGLVDELDPEETVTHEEISPITTPRENWVPTMYGARLRVVEIVTSQAGVLGVVGPQLPLIRNILVASAGVCLVEWTHGGNSNDFLGSYAGMRPPWRGKGKQVFTMNLLPVDNGTFNWLYT
jgi:hypothetical protein